MKYLFYVAAILLTMNISYSCKSIKTNNKEEHTIFLVRHAEKANDGTKDPPLTREGEARANKLADMLAEKNIIKVYSTNYNRTRSTAEPLAKKIGLEVTIYSPSDKEFPILIKKEISAGSILIVGHSNTTPKMVNSIIGNEQFEDLSEKEYSHLFSIKSNGDALKATVGQY